MTNTSLTFVAATATSAPKAPGFCPYPDCYSSDFTFLGYLGDLAYWRCDKCGLDFATNAPKR